MPVFRLDFPEPENEEHPQTVFAEVDLGEIAAAHRKALPGTPPRKTAEGLAEGKARHLDLHPGGPAHVRQLLDEHEETVRPLLHRRIRTARTPQV